MRCVCISDTHGMYDRLQIPDGDVLIHAGDITRAGTISNLVHFDEFLETLPHKHKIVIAGNHDWALEKEPIAARAMFTNATYLEDSEVTIDGIRFYGSPWQPEFCNWAFNLPRGGHALRSKWRQVPNDLDVLITHGPPFGRCDKTTPHDPVSLGCEELRAAVQYARPRFHVFGHIHGGYGTYSTKHTTFINASVCTERYQPTNPPIVFEVEPK